MSAGTPIADLVGMTERTRFQIWTRWLRLDGVLLVLRRPRLRSPARRATRGAATAGAPPTQPATHSAMEPATHSDTQPATHPSPDTGSVDPSEESDSRKGDLHAVSGISNRPVAEEEARQAQVPPRGTRRGETVRALPPRHELHPAPRDPSRRPEADPELVEAEREADPYREHRHESPSEAEARPEAQLEPRSEARDDERRDERRSG